jgi:hypothetical protein
MSKWSYKSHCSCNCNIWNNDFLYSGSTVCNNYEIYGPVHYLLHSSTWCKLEDWNETKLRWKGMEMRNNNYVSLTFIVWI